MTYTGGTPHKTHVIITILALIILAGVLGFFAYQQNPQMLSWVTQPKSADQAPSEVEGWQTYRNEEYGFELNYPADWKIESDTMDSIQDYHSGLATGAAHFAVYPPTSYGSSGFVKKLEITIEKYDEDQSSEYVSSFLEEAFGDYLWLSGKMPEDSPGNGAPIFVLNRGDLTFGVAAYHLSDYESAYRQILATFKFTK